MEKKSSMLDIFRRGALNLGQQSQIAKMDSVMGPAAKSLRSELSKAKGSRNMALAGVAGVLLALAIDRMGTSGTPQ